MNVKINTMKKQFFLFLFLCGLGSYLWAADDVTVKSWQGIHQTTLAQMEDVFADPPATFANHVIWGWSGQMDRRTICNDLDSIKSKGFRAVIFEAGYQLPFKYLSDGWFKSVRTAVLEAKKRGLKVWIIDEGKYPSGFAGGKFTQERPDLRMQALVVDERIPVRRGETWVGKEVPAGVISAVAVSKSGKPNRTVELKDGKLDFNAGNDDWEILLVRSDFRTAVTRAVNNPTGGKDTSNSLCDYLNPVAVQQFVDWTHAQYKKYLGKELGTTVLGFRGDEPDYAHMPWTPEIITVFKQMKGYDPTPWLASFFTPVLTVAEQRVKADYWDVWSTLFATHFFKLQADWCEANGVAYITHLNKDHYMPDCIRAEGDFFRTLSKVQIPGVDAIWNQIFPDTVNNFPKQASSVAHVYGKPRAFSESFAAYYTSPSIRQAKYVVDYQIVRGINFFEFMFWGAGSRQPNWMSDPGMKDLNDYTNRTTYLMTQGKPGARIAMYYPVSTMWTGNNAVYPDIKACTQLLLDHQRDFDYVNEDAFSEALKVGPGYLENMSGQRYYTLIIPSADVVMEKAWEKIREFVARGGKLLFWGRKPASVVGQSFMTPKPLPEVDAYVYEPAVKWTPKVEACMPEPEMSVLQNPDPDIQYTRRVMSDGDLYFIFNQGKEAVTFVAAFDKVGTVREWNTSDGTLRNIQASAVGGRTRLELTLQPWESRIISIEKCNRIYNVKDAGVKGDGVQVETVAIQKVIDEAASRGGGKVVFPEGTYLTGALFFPRGVDLHIDKGATLVSTVNPDDFPVIPTRFEGIERKWRCAFLNFTGSEGVIVDGEGTVDGKGVEWKDIPFGDSGRPRMFCFTDCPGGKISGLKMVNQASWCLHVLYTDGFDIDGVDIRALEYIPSSDGIDIDSSNDVNILNCRIEAHDDCISIKSGKDEDGRRVARPSENILVENCHFAYGHGGVAMGSEVSGGIRNVTVRSCLMDNENWNPLRFKSQPSRGGVVENILFEDVTIRNARNLFEINMEWRMIPPLAPACPQLTVLRNICFRNIYAETQSAGMIHGFKDAPFTKDSFRFENCTVKAQKGLRLANADEVCFDGLNLEVAEGEKFIR